MTDSNQNDYLGAMIEAAAAAGVSPSRFVLPADHHVSLHSLNFHYLDWGNPHLPPLLLLHGGRLQAHTWDLAALLLRDHYHIIALDQRGHGDSDWTPDDQLGRDGFDLMLEDTTAFITSLFSSGVLGTFDKLALVGMSMGGLNTIRYAARHPERLAAAGIVDVAPEILNEGTVQIQAFDRATETLSSFDDFLARSRQYLPHRPVAQLRYSLLHALKQLPEGGWSWKQDHRASVASRSPEVMARNGANGPFFDLWDEVRRIEVPALLFLGAQSQTLSPEIAQRVAQTLPDGDWVTIDPATHNVHSDNPNDFARELHGFLQRRARF